MVDKNTSMREMASVFVIEKIESSLENLKSHDTIIEDTKSLDNIGSIIFLLNEIKKRINHE